MPRADMFHQAVGALTKSLELNPRSPVHAFESGIDILSQQASGAAVEHWRIVSQLDAGYASRREEDEHAASTIPSSRCGFQLARARGQNGAGATAPHTRLQAGYNARAFRYANERSRAR